MRSSNHHCLRPSPNGVSPLDSSPKVNKVSDSAEWQAHSEHKYVLMTAAHNEQAYIEKTIKSVLSQSILPERWVIVSDSSSDRTDEIVKDYARRHERIRYFRISRSSGRSFRSKVIALQAGSKLLEGAEYGFIGNIDADVTVGPLYFEDLITRFVEQPRLGLAGGFVCEKNRGEFRNRKTNRAYSVGHAAQLVRRKCYGEIGGYAILEYGGEDWHAQVSAMMKGWEAKAFPELTVFHLRRTGEAGNLFRQKFRQGRMDYSFGSDPVFVILKYLRRLPEKPLILGSVASTVGFFWSYVCRDARAVSNEFINFVRTLQKRRLADLRITLRTRLNPRHSYYNDI